MKFQRKLHIKTKKFKSIYRKKKSNFLLLFFWFIIIILLYYFIIIFSGSLNFRHVAWWLTKIARWIFYMWHGGAITKIPSVSGHPKLPKYPFRQISQFCSESPPECPEILFWCRDDYQNTLCVGTPKITKIPFLPNFTKFHSFAPNHLQNVMKLYLSTK